MRILHFIETAYILEYGAPCVKCKDKPITIIIRQAAYCSDCFQAVAYHKYRVNVFKTRSGSCGHVYWACIEDASLFYTAHADPGQKPKEHGYILSCTYFRG